MNIVLDIGYDIRGRKQGNKLTLGYRFKETVAAEIQEVRPDEAPVAVVWTARKAIETRWKNYDEELTCGDVNGQMMTRWHAGRHWLRLVEGNCGKTGASSDARELTSVVVAQAASENHHGLLRVIGLERFALRSAKRHATPLGTFAHVETDRRDEALEAVSAISDNFISVGGVLHVACAQPGIRVNDSGKIRSSRNFEENIAIETRARYLDGNPGYMMGIISYPLGDWDEVCRRVHKQALDSGAPTPERNLVRPQVYLPESLNPDIDARRSVDTLVKKVLFAVPALFQGVNPRVQEFFDAPSNQRRDLLERLLDAAENDGTPLHRAPRTDLMRQVEEIEDGMTVEVDLAPATSRLGI